MEIADRSELGWAIIAAKEDDEVASDSDYEKYVH